MGSMKQKTIVIGGTGFLGQGICRELAVAGHNVVAVGRSNVQFPDGIQMVSADVDKMSDDDIKELLRDCRYMVYALGPDDRSQVPNGMSAEQYFDENLVERTKRVAEIAHGVGLEKMVVLGSYFTYFNRFGLGSVSPGRLEKHHPYVEARVRQDQAARVSGLKVTAVEIPYVLGSVAGQKSALQFVFSLYEKSPFLIFGKGGTTVVSVDNVSRSVVRIIESEIDREHAAIGSDDLSYRDIFEMIIKEAGLKKRFWAPPVWLFSLMLRLRYIVNRLKSREEGLDYRFLNSDVLRWNYFVDYKETNKTFNIDIKNDTDEALQDTARSILD